VDAEEAKGVVTAEDVFLGAAPELVFGAVPAAVEIVAAGVAEERIEAGVAMEGVVARDETALALGIKKSAASNRYVRALKRLKDILASVEGAEP